MTRTLRSAVVGMVLAAALPCAPTRAQDVCTTHLGAPPCEGGAGPGSTPAGGASSAHVGNPFDAVSGNKYQSVIDFRALGTPLAFVRHYNSALADRDDGLGLGWRHGYAVELARILGGGYRVRQGDGRAIDFAAEADPGFEPRRHRGRDPGDGWLEVGERHVWVLPDGRRLAFEGPFLDSIRYADGRVLTIERDGARVLSVTDDGGDRLSLLYAAGVRGLPRYGEAVQVPSGHLEAVVLPNGERLEYRYDSKLQLVSVADATGRAERYAYAQDDRPGLLTASDGGAGGRPGRWRYDDGRAVEWFDPSSGDGVVVAARSTNGHRGGTLEVHRSDGDVDLIAWAHDDARPLRPRIDRRRVVGVSRHAGLAGLPVAERAGESPPFATGSSTRSRLPSLYASDHTIERDGRPLEVRAFADRLGTLHDIEVDGRHASDVARALLVDEHERCRAPGGATGGTTGRAVCLAEARALLDLAVQLDGELSRPAYTPRARQHLPGGPACPLPAYVDCAELAHQREMAMLSSCVYDGAACTTGYRTVPPQTIGLDASDMSFGSFHAELSEDPVTGRYVLAFRGTNDVGDWLDNGRNAIGLNSEQYAWSVTLVERLNRHLARFAPSAELELTGHSLGGGLATLAAVTIDRPATVFNPAAVHPDTARWNRQDLAGAGYLVDAIRVVEEPISRGQRVGGAVNFLLEQVFGSDDHTFVGDAPGQHHQIPQPDEAWIKGYEASTGSGRQLAIHSIAGVIRSLDLLHDAHCTP